MRLVWKLLSFVFLIFFFCQFHRKQQPGKLNLKNFAIVNEAIARMNVNSDHNPEGEDKKFRVYNKGFKFDNAPLAAPEDDSDDLAEYAQVKDEYGNDLVEQNMYTFPHDGTPNKSKIRHRRDNKGQSTDIVFQCFYNPNTQTPQKKSFFFFVFSFQ